MRGLLDVCGLIIIYEHFKGNKERKSCTYQFPIDIIAITETGRSPSSLILCWLSFLSL